MHLIQFVIAEEVEAFAAELASPELAVPEP